MAQKVWFVKVWKSSLYAPNNVTAKHIKPKKKKKRLEMQGELDENLVIV